MDKLGKLTIEVDVKGKHKVQDLADTLREIQQPITIRDNGTVNVYVSNTVIADTGDDDEA